MSSNFFIRKPKVSGKLGKRKNTSKNDTKSKKVNNKVAVNYSKNALDSDDISSGEEGVNHNSDYESDENHISAQEKKVSLAKKYLEEIEKEEKERLESKDIQSSVVNRLRDDILDQAGKLNKKVADKLLKPELKDVHFLRCKEHKLSVTCVVISADNQFLFSGSKDAMIVKWSIVTKSKLGVIPSKHKEKDDKVKEHSHNSSILSLAVSYNNKFLASGDESSIIRIWCADTLVHLNSLKGHRSCVTGLAFCPESNNLYSCSRDRSVRVWNLDEMAFVETLFGHQCAVTDVDVLKKDRVVTSGGSDNTLRVWKIQEESQLIFNGHRKSIDRVRKLDQQHFVSCGDDGQICVWGILKKKPLSVIPDAHGLDKSNNEPNWISSVASLQNSDLIVSGSNDGHLRFWKCEENFRCIAPLFTIPVIGFINNVTFSKDGNILVVGIGQEHRLGRWFREKEAKNSILVVQLQYQNGLGR